MLFSTRFRAAGTDYSTFFREVSAPYLRRVFTVEKSVASASLTVCGLGFCRIFVNGNEKTKGALAPYITNPDKVLYYDTCDVTGCLTEGRNVLGFLLGNGMQNCPGGEIWDFEKAVWRSAPKVAFALELTYADGTKAVIEADERLVCAPSPILWDDLRGGERYDARLEIPGWSLPGFDDSAWAPSVPAETPRGECRLCTADPITVRTVLKPVTIRRGKLGKLPHIRENLPVLPLEGVEADTEGWIYDFGVNDAGLCRLHIDGHAGQKLVLQFCEEVMPDGSGDLDLSGMSFLPLKFDHRVVYTCREGEQTYIPSFTYFGFRYVLVMGLEDGQTAPDLLTYEVMSSGFDEIGGFSCSDDVINRIEDAAKRSDRANFYYFPTDCPHREKNGWTADAALSVEQVLSRFRADASYREWLRCIVMEQRTDGALPGIIPTGGWGYQWGNGPAWDSILIWLPYFLYQYRGDTESIRLSASAMLRYLHYLTTRRDGNGLLAIGLGDWCHTGRPSPLSPLIFTDSVISMDLCRKAEVLFRAVGMGFEADYAHALFSDLRRCVRARLIDPDTLIACGNCQTSQAMALFYGVYEPGERRAAFDELVRMIGDNKGLMDVGVLGARALFHVLSAFGRSDLAFDMIRTERYPSFAYWFTELDATSLFEDFIPKGRGINSRNHHFWGDVISWFSRELGGIKVNPYLTDPNEVEVSPRLIPQLDHAGAYTALNCGRLSVSWQRDGGSVLLTVDVPAGAHGLIRAVDGWRFEDGFTERALASGTYRMIPRGTDDVLKTKV